MKNLIITIFLGVFSLNTVYGQNMQAMYEKNGFREFHFGDDVTKFPKLIKVNPTLPEGDEIMYTIENDKLFIGDIPVLIHYQFYKGLFYKVHILTKGESNSKNLLDAIQTLYGPPNPEVTNWQKKYYNWWENDKNAKVSCFCAGILSNDLDCTFTSIIIHNLKNENDNQKKDNKIKKATKDM